MKRKMWKGRLVLGLMFDHGNHEMNAKLEQLAQLHDTAEATCRERLAQEINGDCGTWATAHKDAARLARSKKVLVAS